VDSIEIVPELAARARADLARTGYHEVTVHEGDAAEMQFEPFDAILATAAPDHVPAHLLALLAPGGRLVLPVGGRDEQRLIRIQHTSSGFERQELSAVRFVPMTGRVRLEVER
jgi:protein-L-isoaspartate(D-aspartate) O-methyltransferase